MLSAFVHVRRSGRILASSLAVVGACLPAAASANNQYFAEGRVSTGVTGQASGDDDADRLDTVEAFTVVMPSVMMLRSTSRAYHQAQYTLSTRLNWFGRTSNTLTNGADWRSRFAVSPDSELSLGASAQQGHTSAYELSFPGSVEPFPSGGIHFVSAEANQRYAHRLGRAWRLGQSAEVGGYYPLSGDLQVDHSYQVGGGLDLQRHFRYEAITGAVRGRYVSIARPLIDGVDLPEIDRHLVANAELTGSRALDQRWTANLGAGMAAVTNVDTPDQPLILPTAGAALRYSLGAGSASLIYRHDIDTRLVIGETSAIHLAQLRGMVPVSSRGDVWLAGTLGYRRGRVLDTASRSFIGRNDAIVLDGQVGWEFRRGFTAAARLQGYQQHRSEVQTGLTSDRGRAQVMFSLAARFPSREQIAAPPGLDTRNWASEIPPEDVGADAAEGD